MLVFQKKKSVLYNVCSLADKVHKMCDDFIFLLSLPHYGVCSDPPILVWRRGVTVQGGIFYFEIL